MSLRLLTYKMEIRKILSWLPHRLCESGPPPSKFYMDISVIKYYVKTCIASHLLILHRVNLETILDTPHFLLCPLPAFPI